MKKVKFKSICLGIAVVMVVSTSCSNLSKTQKGVLIGAGAGGAVGAGVGKAAGNTALGAIIGATVGGVTGGIIGKQMDKQAKEIEQIPGAEVKRVGEGINVTFESGVLFGVDQSAISSNAQTKVKELAGVLNKYPDTYVLIEGHTDNSGSDAHNMELSERRAKAVADFLRGQNINSTRLKTAWYGESQPKFTNDNDQNKAKNRRVEFAIYANEQMKEKAKQSREVNGMNQFRMSCQYCGDFFLYAMLPLGCDYVRTFKTFVLERLSRKVSKVKVSDTTMLNNDADVGQINYYNRVL